MKVLLFVLILTTIWTQAEARDPHFVDPGVVTTNTTEVTNNITSSDGNYGLMALAGLGMHFDWGVPNKLQLGAGYVFVPGGNQAVAFGGATRLGGFLVNVSLVTTVDAPETEDDSALIIGAVGHF